MDYSESEDLLRYFSSNLLLVRDESSGVDCLQFFFSGLNV